MTFSVIIPSCNAANLLPCIEAVRRNEPDAPITVVSDGLDRRTVNKYWIERNQPIAVIEGVTPFVYARNINVGIRAARSLWNEPEAFVLLNDDAVLMTPSGFTRVAGLAEEHPEYGVISAATNFVGNHAQLIRNEGFREEPNTLCFVCVLVTAQAIEAVGLLDERFTAYGWEDNDFCRRCRLEHLKLGIYDLCFVDHTALFSSFRGDPTASRDIAPGARIYLNKWGDLA